MVTDLDDRLHGGGQVTAVGRQGQGAGGNAPAAGGGLAVGAKAVVKAPAQDHAAQLEHLRRLQGVRNGGQQALVRRHLQGERLAAATLAAALHHRTAALHQQAARMERPAGPDPLPLDLRIQHKGTAVVIGPVAQLNRVRKRGTGNAQPQPRRLPPAATPLHRLLTATHLPRRALRPGPKHRRQSPLGGQGRHQLTPGRGGDQAQRAIKVALAAAVGATHHRETPHGRTPKGRTPNRRSAQGHRELLQGAIARHRQMAQGWSRTGAVRWRGLALHRHAGRDRVERDKFRTCPRWWAAGSNQLHRP